MPKKNKSKRTPYKYRGFILDDFQIEAIWHLQRNTSTLVCAPTGTGKTLIADYLVEKTLQDGKQLVFTAPIKALVNQKYQEFYRQFGQSQVGIVTGDVSVNKNASLVVMTTEVFRNMLLKDDPHPDIKWVIFDEIHYLDHPERGTVWEEAILLLPKSIGILGLSATIPNSGEIASWIDSVHRPIAVVTHNERAVPLEHRYFNSRTQAVSREELLSSMLSDDYDSKAGTVKFHDAVISRLLAKKPNNTRHLDLVNYVAHNRLLPCLYFVFSRRGCEEKAAQLAKSTNFLRPQEKRTVEVTVRKTLEKRGIKRDDIPHLRQMEAQWTRGIGVHHAGLLPVVKEIVESLLSRKILRLLYVTETFAVGVNMPVRTVCFDSLYKFDGKKWRMLTQQEYFQMAGRAGRRGKDKKGTVLTLVDYSDLQREIPPEWEDTRLEPITSKMSLTFNTVVNLLARFRLPEIEALFARTLASYQYRRQAKNLDEDPANYLLTDFHRKANLLAKLGFSDNGHLTEKGQTCRGIFIQEVLLTELLFQGVFSRLSVEDTCSLLSSVLYEPRAGDKLKLSQPQKWVPTVSMAIEKLQRIDQSGQLAGLEVHPRIGQVIADWVRGVRLRNLLKRYPISEGDFVAICRRTIDLVRQIKTAFPHPPAEEEKLETCIARLDRDVVKVHL